MEAGNLPRSPRAAGAGLDAVPLAHLNASGDGAPGPSCAAPSRSLFPQSPEDSVLRRVRRRLAVEAGPRDARRARPHPRRVAADRAGPQPRPRTRRGVRERRSPGPRGPARLRAGRRPSRRDHDVRAGPSTTLALITEARRVPHQAMALGGPVSGPADAARARAADHHHCRARGRGRTAGRELAGRRVIVVGKEDNRLLVAEVARTELAIGS